MIYSSFNVIAQVEVVWYLYYFVWGFVFATRMAAKDYSNSKKLGWEEYRQKTWMLVPKLFNSTIVSITVYGFFCLLTWFFWSNGGIEATLKSIKSSVL